MGERASEGIFSGGMANRVPAANAIRDLSFAKQLFADVRKCFELNKSCKIL